jgi:hypothetical protein
MKQNNKTNINLPANIHGFRNSLNYTLHGDYYFPDLRLSTTDMTPLGHYGRMRLNYLREYRPGLYTRLILSGKLYEHLAEIDQTSRRRMEQIIPGLAQTEGVEEMLKTTDQMSWVGQMNNIRQRAEEVILNELIYT